MLTFKIIHFVESVGNKTTLILNFIKKKLLVEIDAEVRVSYVMLQMSTLQGVICKYI